MPRSVLDTVKFPLGVIVGVLLAVGLVGLGTQLAGDRQSSQPPTGPNVQLAAYSSGQDGAVNDDDYPQPYRGYAFDAATSSSAPDMWGGFDSRNCTSFVAWRVTSRDQFDMAGWIARNGPPGNAKQWPAAFAGSVRQDQQPAAGSAGVQTGGRYGHVAWVSAVRDDGTIVVEDYNARMTGQYASWVVPASDFDVFLHFEDARPKPAETQAPAVAAPGPLTVTTNGGMQGGGGTDLQGGGSPQGGAGGTELQNAGSVPQGGPAGTVQGPANSGAGGGGVSAEEQQRQAAAAAQAEQQRQAAAAQAAEEQRRAAEAAQAAAAAAAEVERQRIWQQQHPQYPVMNTSESLPDGVWWRNSPKQDDTSRITGFGVYAGDQVRLNCYALGGPAVNGNHVWYRATNLSRNFNGGESAGWISAHYVNDGTGMDQVAPNVQPC